MKNVNIKMENDPDFIEDPRQGRGNVKLKILSVIPVKAGIQESSGFRIHRHSGAGKRGMTKFSFLKFYHFDLLFLFLIFTF